MIRFKQFLLEYNDRNILYHSTRPNAIANILRDNTLKVGWDYAEHPPAVCFTRSFEFAKWWLGSDSIILVIDKDKLRQRYKIQPYNYFPHKANFRTSKFENQQEEQVRKNVTNLDKYLIKIRIPRSFLQHSEYQYFEDFTEKYKVELY